MSGASIVSGARHLLYQVTLVKLRLYSDSSVMYVCDRHTISPVLCQKYRIPELSITQGLMLTPGA